jgi:protein phosphatase 1 regulatory subunit 7
MSAIESWGTERVVWIDSEHVHESIETAHGAGVDVVGISPHHRYQLRSIEFLREYSGIRGVVIPFGRSLDLKPLSSLNDLRYLHVTDFSEPLDLSAFPFLEELRIEWHRQVTFADLVGLRRLYVRGYKSSSRDLAELPAFPSLEELELVRGNLRSLEGVERFARLKKVELHHMRRLESIGALCGTEIKFLHMEKCTSLKDVEVLQCVQTLTALRLHDCGPIPSIEFINALPRLDEFRFVGTVVEDGDLSPLLRLKKVGFMDEANYSHTLADVESDIRLRGQDST